LGKQQLTAKTVLNKQKVRRWLKAVNYLLPLVVIPAVLLLLLLLLLLLSCQGGDDLQMIKRGIMEVADVVLVNKADGHTEQAALQAVSQYKACINLMPHR
jgi:hypothetical protein